MADYIKLKIAVGNDEILSEILVAELADAGVDAFDEEQGILNAYISKDNFDNAVFDALLNGNPFNGMLEYSVEEIKSENWNSVWETNFEPVVIADKCVVYASFHNDLPDAEYKILINPRMTFGTGHHETTYLCAETMLNTDFVGKTVLDMGCGTGILGILAAMKGASMVTAIDNDPTAVENTVENANLNSIADKMLICEGDVSAIAGQCFDIIIANINRNILMNDMYNYTNSLCNKNGILIISGFYNDDIPLLLNTAISLGLKKTNELLRNNWAVLAFVKQHTDEIAMQEHQSLIPNS
jgi:ribosomal protein L11 methyltransferase